MGKVPYQTAEILNHPTIVHGFFGRAGGVSTGIYASLNACLHKGDEDANIDENRRRICKAMGIDRMVTLRQVHKNDVLIVDADTPNGHQMDAMVTKTPGRLLAIQTADCAPILLIDPVARVVGAVHAGWRSAVAGIVKTTMMLCKSWVLRKRILMLLLVHVFIRLAMKLAQRFLRQQKRPNFSFPQPVRSTTFLI